MRAVAMRGWRRVVVHFAVRAASQTDCRALPFRRADEIDGSCAGCAAFAGTYALFPSAYSARGQRAA